MILFIVKYIFIFCFSSKPIYIDWFTLNLAANSENTKAYTHIGIYTMYMHNYTGDIYFQFSLYTHFAISILFFLFLFASFFRFRIYFLGFNFRLFFFFYCFSSFLRVSYVCFSRFTFFHSFYRQIFFCIVYSIFRHFGRLTHLCILIFIFYKIYKQMFGLYICENEESSRVYLCKF